MPCPSNSPRWIIKKLDLHTWVNFSFSWLFSCFILQIRSLDSAHERFRSHY
jgi:hypothetical protein